MKSIINEKAFHFAVRVVRLAQHLANEKKETVLYKQILRSGTSIGANTEEAVSSLTNAEFSMKISIAYKEAKETNYWLRLLKEAGYLDDKEFESMFNDCDEICKMLFSILKSTGRIRKNLNKILSFFFTFFL